MIGPGCRGPNLVLCGFMGSGKSTLAQLVAERSGLKPFDTDAWIESREGLSIARIFADRGEHYFRAIERRAVAWASTLRGAVVATGGGVPLDPENVQQLATTGVVVWLVVGPREIHQRIAGDPSRPLASGLLTVGDVARKLSMRAPYYAALPHHVAASGRPPEAVAEELVGLWRGGLRA